MWDVDLSAPLIADTLDLSNLQADSILISNGTGSLNLDINKTLIDFGLTDVVNIPDTEVVQLFQPTISLTVPPGFDVFNEVDDHFLNIPKVQLKKIRVFSGDIRIKVYNPLGTQVSFDVYLPGVEKNGIPFLETFSIPAGSVANPATAIAVFDLSAYEMDLKGINGNSYNTLRSQVIAKTDPNGVAVNVSTSNLFKVEAKLSNIAVDYARGYFGQQLFSDTTQVEIPYLNQILSGAIDLTNINLNLKISNGMKLAVKSQISSIENTHPSSGTVALSAPQIGQDLYIAPATGTWNNLQPGLQQIQINSGNSNIENLIENLGSQLKIGYVVELNPNGNTNGGWDEIFSTSRIKVELEAQMPLQMQADQLTLVDTFAVDINQDNNKTHITGGYFRLETANAFPFQAQMKLSFLNNQGLVQEEIIGDALLLSSLTGSANTNGVLVKNSTIDFQITPILLEKLNEVSQIKIEAILDTPDANNTNNIMVSVPYNAFIKVKLKAHLNTRIIY